MFESFLTAQLFAIFLFQILLKLGIVVYTALDYNLPPNEDCPMSHELEELIEFMTAEGEYNKMGCRFTIAFLTFE